MAALGESPYFVGIDAGSSSVKVVALHDAGAGFDVAFRACEAHKGSIAACARKLLIAAVSSEGLPGARARASRRRARARKRFARRPLACACSKMCRP